MSDTAKKINYKIIKSKKYKRITLSIKRSQQIIVSAPKGISTKKIDEFVNKNRQWIITNTIRLEENLNTKKHTFLDGDSFLYLGSIFSLKIIKTDNKDLTKLENILKNIEINRIKKEIIITLSSEINETKYKDIVVEFYRRETRKVILTKFEEVPYFNKMKKVINSIKIQKSNGRWGSCSRSNNINFSNRLVMLPQQCIEYVIYHEITHIKEKNHGRAFYLELEKVCPNYKKFELEIKQIEKSHNVTLA
ncbi:MAG: SprT family zinc-dependent metalloprotease [Sphaerochaetaceae bacterium]|nr:SprT family zinc-dependent metalloprotease [Sphaerochaetaceae bacterium]